MENRISSTSRNGIYNIKDYGAVGDKDGRPENIFFISCSNITTKDIFITSSGVWNLHYLYCEDAIVDGIRVYNYSNRNNNGIDIDGCGRFIPANSIFDCHDGAICLESTGTAPYEDIVISNFIARVAQWGGKIIMDFYG